MKNKKTSNQPSRNKKDGLSIAEIISGFGFMALLISLYLGFSYSGVNIGSSVIYAALIALGIGILLYMLLYAKKTESDFKKWKYAEIGFLIVLVAAFIAITPTLSNFFNINSNSDTLKQYAKEDLDELNKAIEDFNKHEKGQLDHVVAALQTVSQSANYDSATTKDLQEYIESESGLHLSSLDDIDSFKNKWNKYIDCLHYNGDGKNYWASYAEAINTNKELIESWGVFKIPQAIADIDKLHNELGQMLHLISQSYPFHKKIGKRGGKFDLVGDHEPFEIRTSNTFKEKCKECSGTNISGILSSFVLFVWIILCYLVAYRSSKVSVKSGSLTNDGGMILKG